LHNYGVYWYIIW